MGSKLLVFLFSLNSSFSFVVPFLILSFSRSLRSKTDEFLDCGLFFCQLRHFVPLTSRAACNETILHLQLTSIFFSPFLGGGRPWRFPSLFPPGPWLLRTGDGI